MDQKVEAIKVTLAEGQDWLPFEPNKYHWVHAIKFSDGSVWDSLNGWRNKKAD